jgi:hypothetical protein
VCKLAVRRLLGMLRWQLPGVAAALLACMCMQLLLHSWLAGIATSGGGDCMNRRHCHALP